MIELALLGLLAVAAGAVAAVAGFGIGSLLTPALALSVGVRAAVVVVAIPHLVITAFRLWRLRGAVDRGVLLGFGLASAVGGLFGALVAGFVASAVLVVVLGGLLILAGVLELSGAGRRVPLGNRQALAAGVASGVFGGLVGNQGGIRAAALLRFDLSGPALVATSTAVALMVDGARLPVYVATGWQSMAANLPALAVMMVGGLAGTIAGEPVLRRLPQDAFRRLLGGLLVGLGVLLIAGVHA